jgi:RNA polymerase sigma factor (sigma-70 family)
MPPDSYASVHDARDPRPEPADARPSGRTHRLTGEESAQLVLAAAAGDARAWERLVDAYVGLIWAIARNHRLSANDAADVSQTTWLRLVEQIDRLNDPSRVGAWLATTARRECLRVLGRAKRNVLLADTDVVLDGRAAEAPEVDAGLLARERDDEVQVALQTLPRRCQDLLQLLMLDPPPSYEEISAALDMPIGSIGPTRGRCLRRLQHLLGREGIAEPLIRVLDAEAS